MMLGREPELPIDLLFGSSLRRKSEFQCTYVQNLQNPLGDIHSLARDEMIKASDRQKVILTTMLKMSLFIQEIMYGCNKKKKGGIYPKFTKSWKGPYFIVAKISDLLYKIQKKKKQGDVKIVHNLLKRYYGKV